MKILKLENGSGDATILLTLSDLAKLAQLCQMAARATLGTGLPVHLDGRDDLATLGNAYAGLFELAGMLTDGSASRGLAAYRQQEQRLDFPFTQDGQHLAMEAKQVDDMLGDVEGL